MVSFIPLHQSISFLTILLADVSHHCKYTRATAYLDMIQPKLIPYSLHFRELLYVYYFHFCILLVAHFFQFALIIVRVSQGISSDQTTYEVPSKMSFAIPVRGTGRQPGESYSLGTMTHDDHNGGSAFSDTMAGSYHTKGELKPGVNVETDYIVSV